MEAATGCVGSSLRSTQPTTTSSIYRKAPGESDRLFLHLRFDLGITRLAIGGEAVEHLGHEAADMPELGDAEAARGAGWRADPDPRRDGRLLGVERHAVLVGGDVGAAERLLRDIARQLLGPEVRSEERRVGKEGGCGWA